MEIKKKEISGVYEIVCKPIGDERGFFMRSYDDKIFGEAGISHQWVQENHSKTEKKGTIRGLHLQLPPFAETKLIRVIRGDVFVDLRKGSETFGRWGSVILSETKHNHVLVPRGFAHSFCTLTANCEVVYKSDNFYSPNHEVGIIWNDKDLGIEWPSPRPILSDKDNNNISFQNFKDKYLAVDLSQIKD